MENIEIKQETTSIEDEKFLNEKQYNVKLDNTECLFIISSKFNSIKFELKPLHNYILYQKVFTLDNLVHINKIFVVFDSIETIRSSLEEIIEKNKFTLQKRENNIEIIFKVPLFEKIIDLNLILEKKIIKQEQLNENFLEEIKILKDDMKILKTENKELKTLNNELKKEVETLKKSNNLLFELYSKVVNQINNIYYETKDNFKFKFLLETNYVITKWFNSNKNIH